MIWDQLQTFSFHDFLNLEQMNLDAAASFGLGEQREDPRLSHALIQIYEREGPLIYWF